ncbi:MAG TPA: hypothetical protein DCS97_11595 [Planctomycetes bacterium]|nr:hypothetical protein [Planctomycetota bacterium]
MRDNADLIRRAADVKQALLMALKHANTAVLDGTVDERDAQVLAAALDQVRRARDSLEFLGKRLDFHREIDRLMAGGANDETSRLMIGLVRMGVDGGYDVGEVRRMVDQALGRSNP